MRGAIAELLADIARAEDVPQVLSALRDASLGASRGYFFATLGRLRVLHRYEILAEFAHDPHLGVEARHLVRQHALREARQQRLYDRG